MPKDYARRGQKYIDQEWNRPKRKRFLPWRAILLLLGLSFLLIYGMIYTTRHKQELIAKIKAYHPGKHVRETVSDTPSESLPTEKPSKSPEADQKQKNQTTPLQFDFYQILPNREVKASNVEEKSSTTAPPANNTDRSTPAAEPKTSAPESTLDAESDENTKVVEEAENTDSAPAAQSVKPNLPASSEAATLLKPSKKNQFLLQLISLTNLEDAKNYQQSLSDKGIKTNLSTAVKEKTTFYRIQMGPYKNRTEAKRMQETLQKQHINSVLVAGN